MSVAFVDLASVNAFREFLHKIPAAKTARRSPESLVNEKIGEGVKVCEGLPIESIENRNYFDLYGKSLHAIHTLHANDSQMLLAVAGAHDLLLGVEFVREWAQKTRGDVRSRSWEYSQAWRQWMELGQHLAKGLAKSRGWILSKKPFATSTLLRLRPPTCGGRHDVDASRWPYVDHAQYFRHPTRPYKPVALLTHSYEPAENVELFATAFGFNCELLEYSWYYPRKCVAALLTPKL